MKANLPQREPEILSRWEERGLYRQLLERRQGAPKFVLHDGPPYANGRLHMGHALNKILKDIIVKYKAMSGHSTPYVPGWDCHGLPIELQLMKELHVDKRQVHREEFRRQAADYAQKFVDIQREEFKRMGVLGDWDHPYLTMDPAYEQVIVEVFNRLKEEGYLYRAKKPVYWCASCETALADAEVEYENHTSASIYVAFPVDSLTPHLNPLPQGERKYFRNSSPLGGGVRGNPWFDAYFVIWTTTPWTLPANVAIAVHPAETYVLFQDSRTGRKFILAEKLIENLTKACGFSGQVLERLLGGAVDGSYARHPWLEDRKIQVLTADFVAMDTGTGLVHIAPGHGMEDYQLGLKWDLPVLSPVDDQGRFTEDFGDMKVKGVNVFEANSKVIEHLRQKGALLHAEQITHSYPHCWRCKSPIIFRATEQWFLNVEHENLRRRLLEAIDQVKWIPEYGKSRISGMVESRPDWCLSRQRFWGTPIPEGNGEDILDVWFESGVSHEAVLRTRPELGFPADMYLEGSDQHRGWFQTSLIPAVALHGEAPYRSVLTHGFVVDGEGRKMSKSLGNVIAPQEVIQEHGAEILRLWVAASDYSEDVRLSPEILKSLVETYRKIRNTIRFLLGNLSDFDPPRDAVPENEMPEMDRWALARLEALTVQVTKDFENYTFHQATNRINVYCVNTLSSLYLDILKDRLYTWAPASLGRRSAQTALYQIAHRLLRLMAPILSFTAEEAWAELHRNPSADSIFLQEWPKTKSFPAEEPGWTWLWRAREDIYRLLEEKRKAGQIGGSLEAWVIIRGGRPKDQGLWQRFKDDLETLFIVSKVSLEAGGAEPIYEIRHARDAGCQKCARCWRWTPGVGADPNHPHLCGRCCDVLKPAGVRGQAS